MEKYNVGLYVTGQIKVHELSDPYEELGDIVNQIYAHTDLLWPDISIEFVNHVVSKDNDEQLKIS